MSDERLCFVISPIGEPESETRKRSDQILKHIIDPAATECGYKTMRADQISQPGNITSQVILHVVDDSLVIADLTERNPNVFYELAIRHAIRKPLVQIIRKGEPIPFDVASERTIPVDHHDLDNVEQTKHEICKQIKSVENDASQIDNPISIALDLQFLRQSGNPEQRSLADILTAISDLRAGVLSIENRLSNWRMSDPSTVFETMSGSIRSTSQNRKLINEIYMLTDEMLRDQLNKEPTDQSVAFLKESLMRLHTIAEHLYTRG